MKIFSIGMGIVVVCLLLVIYKPSPSVSHSKHQAIELKIRNEAKGPSRQAQETKPMAVPLLPATTPTAKRSPDWDLGHYKISRVTEDRIDVTTSTGETRSFLRKMAQLQNCAFDPAQKCIYFGNQYLLLTPELGQHLEYVTLHPSRPLANH